MQLETDDKDHEPIQFSEEFRRAKRNALLWAGIVILLAIGTVRTTADASGRATIANASNVIEVGSMARNLAYSQSALITLGLVVLAFMTLGYIRAEQRLGAFHSKFVIGKRLRATAVLAEQLDNVLAAKIEEVERAGQEAKQLADRFSAATPTFRTNLENSVTQMIDQCDKDVDNMITIPIESGERAPDEIFYRSIASSLKSQHDRLKTQWIQLIDGQIGGFRETQKEVTTTDEWLKQARGHTENLEEFRSGLAQSLEAFSAKIVGGERVWHLFHDRIPVYGAVFLAVLAAFLRLNDPSLLEEYFAPQAHQSPGTQSAPPVVAPSPAPAGTTTPAA